MRPKLHTVVLQTDAEEFADEVKRLLGDIGRISGGLLSAECSPPLDVYETDDTIELVVDLPGVDTAAIRIIAKGSAVLIAGEKAPRRGRGDASFHLVERGYGRFARVARLNTSCNTAAAKAVFKAGELRVSIPKVADRRGRSVPISIGDERPIA